MCRCRKAGAGGYAACSRRCGRNGSSRRPATATNGIDVGEPYSFVFETCTDAVAAYRERLPKMIELAKAMAMARLETEGEYSEARHDAFFAEFGANGLDPEDLALFPDYLICLRAADLPAADSDLLLQAFVAGMPAKVVVQTDDLLEPSPIGSEFLISGLRGRQLASTAIGLARTMSCSRAVAALFQLREQIAARTGLSRAGVVQRFLRRERHRHSALSDGRRRRGIPGVPGVHLRSVGRTGLGIAVLARRQFANRSRLAAAALRLRGRGAAAGLGEPGLYAGRFRGLRSALRQTFCQGAARRSGRPIWCR